MLEGYVKVAKLSDLKEGTLFPITVDDELICLAFVEGNVYAFTDNCTHISGPLNEGELENCVVTCPWHGARFDVRDGKVLRGPARQGLYTYPVKIDGDDISVCLPPEV